MPILEGRAPGTAAPACQLSRTTFRYGHYRLPIEPNGEWVCCHVPTTNRIDGPAMAIESGSGATPMKRVAAACLIGSTIEYFDFFIYGTAAALVFPVVFFPHLSAAMATTASMGTFAAAFLSRPAGAVVFGHLGTGWAAKRPWSPRC
jgi:hypothetical protein